jgi:hypothetical protein
MSRHVKSKRRGASRLEIWRKHRLFTNTEIWRVSELAKWGFHYRTMAAYLHRRTGDNATDAEAARVGRLARKLGMSSLAWRKGKTPTAASILSRVSRSSEQPVLKLVSKVA